MIELRALTKSFRTVHGRHYVFRDLSLTFPKGTNIGLIGPNGAGKSTLMRIIGGIDTPDHGAVVTDQRISFPVGLSGGFQGTLSGRDNAKFVCRLYGVNPNEVRDKVAFVEEFAELGKYFDMPIKTYSSGMRSRLIFGLSMAFDFDYYLMDEVGAVGDAGFKTKSRQLLESKIGKANVICVSHNMNVIREQCHVVVLLRGGDAVYYADLEQGIQAYQGDAYVPTAATRRRRRRAVKIDQITPRDVRQARRIIRAVRQARSVQAESTRVASTTSPGAGEVLAMPAAAAASGASSAPARRRRAKPRKGLQRGARLGLSAAGPSGDEAAGTPLLPALVESDPMPLVAADSGPTGRRRRRRSAGPAVDVSPQPKEKASVVKSGVAKPNVEGKLKGERRGARRQKRRAALPAIEQGLTGDAVLQPRPNAAAGSQAATVRRRADRPKAPQQPDRPV